MADAPKLPPLPAHPEPHTHRWTDAELRAIQAAIAKKDAAIKELREALKTLCKLALNGESVLWTAEYDQARTTLANTEDA